MAAVPSARDDGSLEMVLLEAIGRPVSFKDNAVPATCTEMYRGRARLFAMTVNIVKGRKRSEWELLGSQTGRDVVRIIQDSRKVVSITMHDRKLGTMILNVPLLPYTRIAVAADFASAKPEEVRAWVFDAHDYSAAACNSRHFALRFTRDRVKDPSDPTGKKQLQLDTSHYAQNFEKVFNIQRAHMKEHAAIIIERARAAAAASGSDGESGPQALQLGLESLMDTRTHITEVSEEEETDTHESERKQMRSLMLSQAAATGEQRRVGSASDADQNPDLAFPPSGTSVATASQGTQEARPGPVGDQEEDEDEEKEEEEEDESKKRQQAGRPGRNDRTFGSPASEAIPLGNTPEGSIAMSASPGGNDSLGFKLTPVQSPAYSLRSGRSALRRERVVADEQEQEAHRQMVHREQEAHRQMVHREQEAHRQMVHREQEAAVGPTAKRSLTSSDSAAPRRDIAEPAPMKAASGSLAHSAAQSASASASASASGSHNGNLEKQTFSSQAVPSSITTPVKLQGATATQETHGESSNPRSQPSESVASSDATARPATLDESMVGKATPVNKVQPSDSLDVKLSSEGGSAGVVTAVASTVAVALAIGAIAAIAAHRVDRKGRTRSWNDTFKAVGVTAMSLFK